MIKNKIATNEKGAQLSTPTEILDYIIDLLVVDGKLKNVALEEYSTVNAFSNVVYHDEDGQTNNFKIGIIKRI